MNSQAGSGWTTGLLLAVWLLVLGWQAEEHHRVVEASKLDLRGQAHQIANTISATIRGMRIGGTVVQDRLDPVLQNLTNNEVLFIALLNTNGDQVMSVGNTNFAPRELPAGRESWSDNYATFVQPVEGMRVSPVPGPWDFTNALPRGRGDFFRRPDDFTNGQAASYPTNTPEVSNATSNAEALNLTNAPAVSNPSNLPDLANPGNNQIVLSNASMPSSNIVATAAGATNRPPGFGERPRRNRRAPWLNYMSEADYNALIATHELHGLLITMSTDRYRATLTDDLWLRCVIAFFAGISALGAGLAWRNIGRTADLQIRLVRASELNSHLKELNLAAAGLAHETRNPLNIIRGQAQMISRLADAPPAVREKSKTIVDETDKVTAQLTEFINYSRPREVRRTRVPLIPAANEVIRTLALDIEQKKLQIEAGGESLAVEADEQLLRQLLFNLIINAIQAVDVNGKIQLHVQRVAPNQAVLEVRDDGPGVPAENRQEIFKPYFTTYPRGTGLGLAVVQQIVLAHGWEIVCLAQEPHGAVFRISHLKIVT